MRHTLGLHSESDTDSAVHISSVPAAAAASAHSRVPPSTTTTKKARRTYNKRARGAQNVVPPGLCPANPLILHVHTSKKTNYAARGGARSNA